MHFRVRILLCLLLLASQVGLAAPAKRKKAKQQPPPEPVQQAPEPPKPPPTPEEMPAVPPRVSMNNGMLTISADNSTMGDILGAVRKQTGAVLEVPPGLQSERVATRLGPGTPQSVIQQLFIGSKFDYIIVGSPQDPSALQRIIVTPRGAGGAATMASNQPVSRPPQAYQPPPDTAETNEAIDETPEPEPEPAPPEQPVVTPPTQAQPYSNQPKTPEQLLQELQQMQQQQQQGGRPPRNPGPQAPPQPE